MRFFTALQSVPALLADGVKFGNWIPGRNLVSVGLNVGANMINLVLGLQDTKAWEKHALKIAVMQTIFGATAAASNAYEFYRFINGEQDTIAPLNKNILVFFAYLEYSIAALSAAGRLITNDILRELINAAWEACHRPTNAGYTILPQQDSGATTTTLDAAINDADATLTVTVVDDNAGEGVGIAAVPAMTEDAEIAAVGFSDRTVNPAELTASLNEVANDIRPYLN